MNAFVVLALMATLSRATVLPTTHDVRWASPTQEAAFRYGKGPHLLSGGWGAGKTWDCCMKALWLSTTYPKNRGVIARHVGKDLRATTAATLFKVLPPRLYSPTYGGRRNDQEGYIKLIGCESEILLMHFEGPDVSSVIKGLEINWFFIDQAEENPEGMEEVFDMLLGRLGRWDKAEVPDWILKAHRAHYDHPWPYVHPESGKPVPPPYAMLACNPDVETHWLYRRFHEDSADFHQTYQAQGYKIFHMPSEENQFLGETNLKFLLNHDDAFIRRNVRGLWGLPEGSIHVVDKLSIIEGHPDLLEYFRQSCTLYRLLDHGDSAPTCCLWMAVDRNGNLFFYREYYLPNALISTHRQEITALSEGERYEQDLADPSIFNQTMQSLKKGRYSVADEYADVREQPRESAIFWTPAENNELGTRNRINEYLRVDPDRVHPIYQRLGSPKLFFVKANEAYPQGCLHSIRETRSQRRVKIGTNLGKAIYSDERSDSVPDHAYDPLRYGVASRPATPGPVVAEVDGTFNQKRRLLKLARKRGLA